MQITGAASGKRELYDCNGQHFRVNERTLFRDVRLYFYTKFRTFSRGDEPVPPALVIEIDQFQLYLGDENVRTDQCF